MFLSFLIAQSVAAGANAAGNIPPNDISLIRRRFSEQGLPVASTYLGEDFKASGTLPELDDAEIEAQRRRIPKDDMTKNPADYRWDSPDPNDLRYHLYQPGLNNPRETWRRIDDAYNSGKFNPTWPIVYVQHGFSEGAYGSTWISTFRDAFFKKYSGGLNLIMVDARSHFGTLNYPWAAFNTQDLGYTLARLQIRLEDKAGKSLAENTQCVGHSLGAQTCARFGRTYDAFKGRKIGRITLLDAAKPMFEKQHDLGAFCARKTDGAFVEAVHTNAGINEYSLWTSTVLSTYIGVGEPMGHVDYYMNGGQQQPRCKHHIHGHGIDHWVVIDFETLNFGCDHERSWKYYATSIKNGPMYGQKCDNFNSCYCSNGAQCTSRRGGRRAPGNREEAALGGNTSQRGLVFVRTSGDRSKDYRCANTITIRRHTGTEELCEYEKCYAHDDDDGFYDLNRKYHCNVRDGTPCDQDTTCYNCINKGTFWNGPMRYQCGREPCWGKDTMCYAWSCNSCCRGADHPWWAAGTGWCK